MTGRDGAARLRLVSGEVAGSRSAPTVPDADILRMIVEASPDCITVVELDGRLTFMNANGLRAMEVDDWSTYEGRPWDTLWPASTQREILDAVAAACEGRETRIETYCPTAKGSPRWWDVSVAPALGPDNKPHRIVAVSRDVTDRIHRENQLRLHEIELNQLAIEQADTLREQKASIEASDQLMREVDHRMKNSLAMLGSLLKMETRRVSDEGARATLKAAAARVATIASVHEQLHRGTEKDALSLEPYLSALVRDLVNSMSTGPNGGTIRAEVTSDDIVMRGGKALALGLATVELLMNAIRHGSEGADANIVVACRREGEAMRLVVSDSGAGLPEGFDPATSTGLGMRVVQSSLSKLEGELSFANGAEGGAVFTLVWPV